jgi:hypothetical protein
MGVDVGAAVGVAVGGTVAVGIAVGDVVGGEVGVNVAVGEVVPVGKGVGVMLGVDVQAANASVISAAVNARGFMRRMVRPRTVAAKCQMSRLRALARESAAI